MVFSNLHVTKINLVQQNHLSRQDWSPGSLNRGYEHPEDGTQGTHNW